MFMFSLAQTYVCVASFRLFPVSSKTGIYLKKFSLTFSYHTISCMWSLPSLDLHGCTFMSRNKQSQKYLIGRSYKNDEFDRPFLFGDCIIVWHESVTLDLGPLIGS